MAQFQKCQKRTLFRNLSNQGIKKQLHQQQNGIAVSIPILDPPPISKLPVHSDEDDVPNDVEDTNPPTQDNTYHHIQPSTGLTEFKDVDRDYMEYIFPTALAASVDLWQIPSNYIDYLTPSANMADKQLPVLQKNSSHVETDEIFAHGILQTGLFHVDWVANIIIVNDKSFFTEFFSCNECLSPINDIPYQPPQVWKSAPAYTARHSKFSNKFKTSK